jgi:LmbE family N-acetylglucosaminyl deacetylase
MLVSRRRALVRTGRLALGWAGTLAAGPPGERRLKVVVTGGHPGDPECGCAGTIARYVEGGHRVTVLYLNRGEGYCGGQELERCGTIRTREAERASALLGARPLFAAQRDGEAVVDPQRYREFAALVGAENPDVVFTHWPIDAHRDHRAVSALVLDAWLETGKGFALYYYEVAEDTLGFTPDAYVDISHVEARRRAACFAHASQQPARWYPLQEEITRRRGGESGHAQAEAFLRQGPAREGRLP